MSKVLLYFSTGKESLSTYYRLVDQFGVDNVYPVFLRSLDKNLPSLVGDKWVVENIINNFPNSRVIDIAGKTYQQYTKEIFAGLSNLEDFYVSSGMANNVEEICEFWKTIKSYNLKGYYNPHVAYLNVRNYEFLSALGCRFMVVGGYVPPYNSRTLKDDLKVRMGTVYTTEQLLQLRSEAPGLFNTLQTVLVSNNVLQPSADSINSLSSKVKEAAAQSQYYSQVEL